MDTAELIASREGDSGSSARVLLTTIFGDALLPRGQSIGVQQLAQLVAPAGINERLVRTSLQRLSAERLVCADRVGRRAFYRVADDARATFAQAEERIYHRRSGAWDGQWTIAVIAPDAVENPAVADLRRGLGWLGVGRLGPTTFVSPTMSVDVFAEASDRTGLPYAVLTRAPVGDIATIGDIELTRLVTELDELGDSYRAHTARFGAVAAPSDGADAFLVRTMLIDSWRRLALRDPDLPTELLTDNWPAAEGFATTAALYRAVDQATEHHLDAVIGPSDVTRPQRF